MEYKSRVLQPLKKLCTIVVLQRSFVSILFHLMIKKFLIALFCILPVTGPVLAQLYVLECSRWSDMSNKSIRNAPSTISIDSSLITISQGPTNLYLEIKKQTRTENNFTYDVIDPNDVMALAQFSPEDMLFDYRAGQFWLRYFIETIQRPVGETKPATPTDTTALQDTSAVVEDKKIYETADVAPEFPGGKEAMDTWIAQNIKYPAAAKKSNIKGVVTITAVVEKDGSLSEVKVKKDIGGGCGDEAVRVVKLMPSWIPGMIKNEDKRVRVTVSIFFPPE